MKALGVIKKILIGITGVIFFIFALTMTILLLNYNDFGVTQFGNTSLIIINDSLSTKNYKKGDLVLVDGLKIEQIKEGNEIFVYQPDQNGVVSINLGVVGKVHADDNAISFENGANYSMKYVIGESTKIYNNLGFFLSLIESKWGFLFIILVPSFMIFIYEFYALIVEIKYGKEDNLTKKS